MRANGNMHKHNFATHYQHVYSTCILLDGQVKEIILLKQILFRHADPWFGKPM